MAPGVSDIIQLNLPNEYRDKDGLTGNELSTRVLGETEKFFKLGNVAAFISEAIFTNVGTILPPADFYPKLQELCKRYKVLFTIDEVAGGFGRTGKMYAFEHFNLEPDIVCLGKGLTGGYSTAGATICTSAIEAESHKIPSYSTFGWNLYDLVAMEENLNIILENKLWEKSKDDGEYILSLLKPMEELPFVGQIRGIGMLFSIEFVKDKVTKEPLKIAGEIQKQGFEAGIITETADEHILFFSPSLSIEKNVAETGINRLVEIITQYKII